MPDATRHLTLANGLQLTLRHAPRLKRSAAALRVHAGSHDAPAKWPGLAHFLEHLFFLGTSRFALNDGLMRYVQTLGGQVNASTRERTTDFFFEVPPSALTGGLERLCQMLAEPDLPGFSLWGSLWLRRSHPACRQRPPRWCSRTSNSQTAPSKRWSC